VHLLLAENGVGMLAEYYIIIDDSNPELHHKFDGEAMQEFIINHARLEGVLYHTEMSQIKILYNAHNGEVKLVDVEKKQDINSDYSDAFQARRKEVELAIRRWMKLELLAELNKMNDMKICGIIGQNHDLDPGTGKIISNTSEIALDMTLVKIIKLGYAEEGNGFSLRRFFYKFTKKNQTAIQKAIYAAFEDLKKECERSSHVLNQLKSKKAIQQFKDYINKHL